MPHSGPPSTLGVGNPAPPFDLRLIDLGNAVFAADTIPGVTAGTPSYLSPEARGGQPWGPGVDVWAAGRIIHEIIAGGAVDWGVGKPGEGDASCGLPGDAGTIPRSQGVGPGPSESGRVMRGLLGLLERLLETDVAKRPTAQEALDDPVFRG